MARIAFQSHVAAKHRAALEALMFFNSRQQGFSARIAEAIERFGSPEIIAQGDRLRIHVPGVADAQSLFAIESDTGRPVGVAVYARPDFEQITVIHVSIAQEFAWGGRRANEQLLLRLLRELRRCTRRMKGVRRIELYYLVSRAQSERWRTHHRHKAVV